MSRLRHESAVLLLRSNPKLVAELCLDVLGMRLPTFSRIELDDPAVQQLVRPPLLGDLLYRLVDEDGTAVHGVVIEVHRSGNEDKRYAWLHYVAGSSMRLRCPVDLMVVGFDPAAVRLAQQPIPLSLNTSLTPWLLRSDMIPIITDPAEVDKRPDWGFLSVLAHIDDNQHAPAVFRAAIDGLARKTDEDSRLKLQLVHLLLQHEASEEVRNMVNITPADVDLPPSPYYTQSFLRAYDEAYTAVNGRYWRSEGRAEGRTEGAVNALLTVLDSKGLSVPASLRAWLSQMAQSNPSLDKDIDRWLRHAIAATSLEDIFGRELLGSLVG